MLEKAMLLVKAIAGWAKTIPSGSDGNGSSSRIIGLMVASGVMGVLVGYFMVRHDVPSAPQLYGLAAILGTGIGAYVAKQFRQPDGSNDQTGGEGK